MRQPKLTQAKLTVTVVCGAAFYLLFSGVYAVLGLYFPLEHYLFLLWLFMMFFLPIPFRLTLAAGLIFLGLCPLTLTFQNDDLTNRLARIAFFLLALGGLQVIINRYFSRRGENFENGERED